MLDPDRCVVSGEEVAQRVSRHEGWHPKRYGFRYGDRAGIRAGRIDTAGSAADQFPFLFAVDRLPDLDPAFDLEFAN
jgi:hypothetical protein